MTNEVVKENAVLAGLAMGLLIQYGKNHTEHFSYQRLHGVEYLLRIQLEKIIYIMITSLVVIK